MVTALHIPAVITHPVEVSLVTLTYPKIPDKAGTSGVE